MHKGLLHFIHSFRRAQPFDARDFVAFGFNGQHGAGINRMAVHQHGTGAARAAVTDLFAPGEVEPVAQRIEQSHARLDAELAVLSVDFKSDGDFARTDDASFPGEGLLQTDGREQARRHRPDAESFEEATPRKAGRFRCINFVRHSRLS